LTGSSLPRCLIILEVLIDQGANRFYYKGVFSARIKGKVENWLLDVFTGQRQNNRLFAFMWINKAFGVGYKIAFIRARRQEQ